MENIINMRCNTKLDKIKKEKNNMYNKILKAIKKNKFITLACSSFLVLSVINFYLIYSFTKILENM